MKKKFLTGALVATVVGSLVVTPAVQAQENTSTGSSSRCERMTDKLSDFLARMNDIKVNKIDKYDEVTDKIVAVTQKYMDATKYPADVVSAATTVYNDGLALSAMISGDDPGDPDMTMSISDHYYDVIAKAEAAQNKAARCDEGEGQEFKDALQALKDAWVAFRDDRQDVVDFWNDPNVGLKKHLKDLRDAVKSYHPSPNPSA